jgi:hypothetical protein
MAGLTAPGGIIKSVMVGKMLHQRTVPARALCDRGDAWPSAPAQVNHHTAQPIEDRPCSRPEGPASCRLGGPATRGAQAVADPSVAGP